MTNFIFGSLSIAGEKRLTSSIVRTYKLPPCVYKTCPVSSMSSSVDFWLSTWQCYLVAIKASNLKINWLWAFTFSESFWLLKLLFHLMHRYPFHISLMLSFNFSRVNISMGPLEERMMLSGMHTVADIFCCCCGQNVGWKYVSLISPFFFGSGFLFLTLFLSLFGRNQRMRKIRNIKKANLFWKGNQLLLWKVSLCPTVHSFSHKLRVLLQSFSEEGSCMDATSTEVCIDTRSDTEDS